MFRNIVALSLLLVLSTCASMPVNAQEVCVTVYDVKQTIEVIVPDSFVAFEDSDTVVFASPSRPTYFQVQFDEKGCLFEQAELDKVAFELMYSGV
jgi:hypothetical protein